MSYRDSESNNSILKENSFNITSNPSYGQLNYLNVAPLDFSLYN